MRPTKAITTCAVTALAMVFSVQQGEHGPLVTYKLKVPNTVETAAVPPATAVRLPAGIAPLQATAPAAPKLEPPPPATAETPPTSTAESTAADYRRLFREAGSQSTATPLQHAYTGEAITLEQVNAELEWRRNTAKKLRRLTVGPRF